jgi:DNA (cytosine-5)-methyltransferase 3A
MKHTKGNGITVLSLFDGMSCGQIALRELGVKYARYYASEVDKHAIAQAQLNFPDTVQLGDVRRWREWTLDWGNIDLILAGSPCQGFSIAGKMLGFQDARSRLFFDFADILSHARAHNPRVKFLLENVQMRKSDMRVVNSRLGLYPVTIDSALVSAQSRKRCYWSNIRIRCNGLFGEPQTDIPQPPDRGILLKDILDDNVPDKYTLRGNALARIIMENPCVNRQKAYCVSVKNNTSGYGNERTMTVIQLNPSKESGGQQPYQQNMVYDDEGKSPAHMAELCCGNYAILQRRRGFNKGGVKEGKSPSITAHKWEYNNHLLHGNIRRLTPTECARLQTVPDWYKWACSDTQQYRMLGNGWTVEVIKHILSYMGKKNFGKKIKHQ